MGEMGDQGWALGDEAAAVVGDGAGAQDEHAELFMLHVELGE